MQLLYWEKVDRKRSREIPYNHKDFVRGYDLDMVDFTSLVEIFNRGSLTSEEETRLYDYVRTMMNIVFENPKINPRNTSEKEDCADFAFPDAWGSLRYIKGGASPYSYVYRSIYTAACRYFKKKISDRKKEEAIAEHLQECYIEYLDATNDRKRGCPSSD